MPDVRSLTWQARGPVLVVVAALFGLRFPVSDALTVATIPLVAFLVFGALYGHDWSVFRSHGRPRFAVVALGVVYLLPVLFAPIPTAVLDGPALVGVLVATAAPTTAGSAIVWTRHGGGETALTVLAALGAIAIAPVVSPGVLAFIGRQAVALDPLPVVRDLLLIVGGGGVLLRAVPPGAMDTETLDTLSLLAVGALVYVATATSAMGSIAVPTLAIVGLLAAGFLAAAAVVAAGFALLVGRERAVALFYTAGLRNLGIAVALATALPVEGAVVAVVAFYVTQQLLAGVISEGIRSGLGSESMRVFGR